MKIEFRVFIREQDFHEIKKQGFEFDDLWTHQEAIKWLDNQGFESIYTYDYSIAKQEKIIIKTYQIDDETVTMFNLKFPQVYTPVRNYEVVTLIT